ncbi:MAG: glycerol-3-phosphate 1-O-acyltransferase PlsY [Armatimonadota bacterium]|nr:glycerol-3-phosphate 1-O-acyltransferase PlsY [Armatimonadota bacterium]
MTHFLVLTACYLMGAIPFGLIVGKMVKGVDIRKFGSGNIGATNVYRTLGAGPALLVFVLDTAKGFLSVVLCKSLALGDWFVVAGGLLAVMGHTFSVFLRFSGGRGVATALGVIIGLTPAIAAVALGLWILVVAISKYISVASILAAISVPILMILWKSMRVPQPYIVLACTAAAAIVLRHIPNMRRLASGTEPRIGQKANPIKEGSDRTDG